MSKHKRKKRRQQRQPPQPQQQLDPLPILTSMQTLRASIALLDSLRAIPVPADVAALGTRALNTSRRVYLLNAKALFQHAKLEESVANGAPAEVLERERVLLDVTLAQMEISTNESDALLAEILEGVGDGN